MDKGQGTEARHGEDAGAADGDRGAEKLEPRTGTGQQVGRGRGPGRGSGGRGSGADGDRTAEAAGVPGRRGLGARGDGHAGGRGPGNRRRPPRAAPAEREARARRGRGRAGVGGGRGEAAPRGSGPLGPHRRAPGPRPYLARGGLGVRRPHLERAPRPSPRERRRPRAPPDGGAELYCRKSPAADLGAPTSSPAPGRADWQLGSAWPCCYPAPEAEARACAMGPRRRLLRVLGGCGGRATPRARCGRCPRVGGRSALTCGRAGGAAQAREPSGRRGRGPSSAPLTAPRPAPVPTPTPAPRSTPSLSLPPELLSIKTLFTKTDIG